MSPIDMFSTCCAFVNNIKELKIPMISFLAHFSITFNSKEAGHAEHSLYIQDALISGLH